MPKSIIFITFFTLFLPCISKSMDKEEDIVLNQSLPKYYSNIKSNDEKLSPIKVNKKLRLDSQGKVIPLTIKITKPVANHSPVQETPNNSSLYSSLQVEKPPSDQDINPKENPSQYPLKTMQIVTKPSTKPGWKRYLLVEIKTSTEEVCGHDDSMPPNSHTEIQK